VVRDGLCRRDGSHFAFALEEEGVLWACVCVCVLCVHVGVETIAREGWLPFWSCLASWRPRRVVVVPGLLAELVCRLADNPALLCSSTAPWASIIHICAWLCSESLLLLAFEAGMPGDVELAALGDPVRTVRKPGIWTSDFDYSTVH
jgi:hypothetical protein